MPAPQAQASDSRPHVAIPISSLLSDTGANYGPEDGQNVFGIVPKQEDNHQASGKALNEDDNYDDDEEDTKPAKSMQVDLAPQTESTSASAASAAPAVSAETYKREEDEDYDE